MWGACRVSLKVLALACSEMKRKIPVGRDLASVPIHLPKQHMAGASVSLSVEWGERSKGHRKMGTSAKTKAPWGARPARLLPVLQAFQVALCREAIPALLHVRLSPWEAVPVPNPSF